MQLRYVSPTTKAQIVALLHEDSRRTCSSIAARLGLDVRVVVAYVELLRREYRFTLVRRSPDQDAGLPGGPSLRTTNEV